MVSTTPVQSWREPQIEPAFLPTMEVERLTLTEAQKTALNKISASLRGEAGPKVFLLHGVTGSGKTEVYLRALEETIASGKRGIVLVPEIALTPQTMERFASRFPHRVAIWHSQLSLGEQLDQWHRIKAGDFDVVLGPRSALFVPQPNLGLIVIDEEHEWTYKQQEQSPYYQAREVALKLTELTGATVILGSATPSVESFYQAQFGRYQLLELPQRITPAGLPEVEVVDMRQELKGGNRSIFSNLLKVKIMNALIAQEQAILFLNRRGTATFIQCRHCGSVLCCPRCDLPLTYHATEEILLCHQCNYRRRVPQVCPECSQRGIKFLGLGTERVAREIGQTFPTARVLRWDRDVTRGKYAHQRILHKFLSREADILIGTQMIAKGLDFPKVALVGIISADTVLHLPDFRAGERTFQLLSQVAGRAGRGDLPGKVIIQTYTPNHYAVQTAANYDYSGLYQHEIKSRQKHNQPPFSQLVCLTYAHYKLANCQRETKRLYARLNQEKEAQELSDIEVMGPFPAFFSRRRGRYRWQIILRGFQPSRLLSSVALPQGWSVDVDPISLL
jgi:primosomal protein N' (replication factor Y)